LPTLFYENIQQYHLLHYIYNQLLLLALHL
jgi:hypothetical protein